MNKTILFCAASVSLAFAASSASASVVSSGTINLAIPNTSVGLYVNFIDGTSYTGPNTFPSVGGPGANYDFCLFGTTSWSLFAPGTSGQSSTVPTTSKGYVASSSTGPAVNLTPGSVIDGTSFFNNSAATTNLTTGTDAYIGLRFRNEGADLSVTTDDTVHYGYAHVILTNGQPGTLVDYAYESTPLTAITVAAVPEPTSMAVLGLGALALIRRRRNAKK